MKDEKVSAKDGCTHCGACVEACPEKVISIEDASQTSTVSDGHQGVWVFAEQRDGILKSVSFELLAKGRELADILKTELCAVCLGSNVDRVEQLTMG
jgi:electron transfer flavoprotein alpha subunit